MPVTAFLQLLSLSQKYGPLQSPPHKNSDYVRIVNVTSPLDNTLTLGSDSHQKQLKKLQIVPYLPFSWKSDPPLEVT